MRELKLPPTIRTCTLDEVPQYDKVRLKIADRVDAKITEGYTFNIDGAEKQPFNFFAEINIDNDRLWSLFKILMLQLPDEIACIYHHIDNKAILGNYLDKFEVLNVLEKYEVEITGDGFIELGVIFNSETSLEEVFIKRTKYIQYWGMDAARLRKTMDEFSLYQIDDLNFLDEYLMATEWLKGFNPNVLETSDLILELDKVFTNDI